MTNGRAYYNEFDPYAAQWLRNLIAAGHIADGDVDERSIEDVRPCELRGYSEWHLFAGVGVWSYALRLAGWPAGRPVLTCSCPCQPFSAAGKGAGFDDQRHLWPAAFHIIRELGVADVFGEQVASKDAEPWIDLVHADMESMGHAFGCIPFPAASVGAPNIRDRAYWMAHAGGVGRLGRSNAGRSVCEGPAEWGEGVTNLERNSAVVGLADALRATSERQAGSVPRTQAPERRAWQFDGDIADRFADGREDRELADPDRDGCDQGRQRVATARDDGAVGDRAACGMANAAGEGRRPERSDGDAANGDEAFQRGPAQSGRCGAVDRAGPSNGFWRAADWLLCRDGKWRPVEPGAFPLVDGSAFRVGSGSAFEGKSRSGMLKGYGNAINAEAAAAFIRAYLECSMSEAT